MKLPITMTFLKRKKPNFEKTSRETTDFETSSSANSSSNGNVITFCGMTLSKWGQCAQRILLLSAIPTLTSLLAVIQKAVICSSYPEKVEYFVSKNVYNFSSPDCHKCIEYNVTKVYPATVMCPTTVLSNELLSVCMDRKVVCPMNESVSLWEKPFWVKDSDLHIVTVCFWTFLVSLALSSALTIHFVIKRRSRWRKCTKKVKAVEIIVMESWVCRRQITTSFLFIMLLGFFKVSGVLCQYFAINFMLAGDALVIRTFATVVVFLLDVLTSVLLCAKSKQFQLSNLIGTFLSLINSIALSMPRLYPVTNAFVADGPDGVYWAISSAVFSALSIICERRIATDRNVKVHVSVMVFVSNLVGVLECGCIALFITRMQVPGNDILGFIMLSALLGFVAHLCFSKAVQMEEIGPVSIIQNSEGLLVIYWHWAVFKQFTLYEIVWQIWNLLGLIVNVMGASFWIRSIHRKRQRAANLLSKEQIQRFHEGNPTIITDNDNDDNTFSPENLPYNSKYELVLDKDFRIRWDLMLGEGQFGRVYYGKLFVKLNENGQKTKVSQEIAIKMFKEECPSSYFHALLCELKILSYVGQHENIVSLCGACTSQIKHRIIYIAVEYCSMGDLKKYLVNNREGLEGQAIWEFTTRDPDPGYDFVDEFDKSVKTLKQSPPDLIRWSRQIANGMSHLASTRVTHGDLAARNVLLTQNLDVKISDFGLAHRLYGSREYASSSNTCHDAPVPWCWMSPESLRDLKFSSKSDVWAYGVTIWEIFSLGQFPFTGFQYGPEFLRRLEKGHRLRKTDLATNQMYKIMTSCWNSNPDDRPDFHTLKTLF